MSQMAGPGLVLQEFEASPFCDKIRRVLNFKGLAYESKVLPLIGKRPPKLPVLVHGSKVVADSSVIARYIEKTFPDRRRLIPTDPAEAALVHVFEEWADESLYYVEMRMRFIDGDNAQRFIPLLLKDDSWATRQLPNAATQAFIRKQLNAQGTGLLSPEDFASVVQSHFEHLSALIGRLPWLVGDRISLADIAVFVMFTCIVMTPEGSKLLAAYPNIAAYLERVDKATQSTGKAKL